MQKKQEKILILGGSYFQLPVIKYAKSQGYQVITCDYLPENIGHKFADHYYNVSTTDKEAVLTLAKELEIDGILCFASDPAVTTAAYVAEQLGLPGNTLENITKLAEKDVWRQFLKENDFLVPRVQQLLSTDDFIDKDWNYPLMVKPVDASGSKGVSKIYAADEVAAAFEYALGFSRAKRVIVEEFIEKVGYQVGGDGFYGEDKLDFLCMGEQVFDEKSNNPFVPCGLKVPARMPQQQAQEIHNQLERAIRLSGLRNIAFNLEVIIDKLGRIHLLEIGPRNGGNCIPEVIYNHTHFDMHALAVEKALGHDYPIIEDARPGCKADYVIHSHKSGLFQGIQIREDAPGTILSQYIMREVGEEIHPFNGSHHTIGWLLMHFDTHEQMDLFFEKHDEYVEIVLIDS